VASAGTAETVVEIMKCMCDVDMRGRVRMGSKSQIFMFFNSGYANDRNISIFRRRASTVTGNTLIEPNYASVRQPTDSLHRGTHTMTKKSRRRRALKPLELKSSKNSQRRVLWHTRPTMPVNLVEIDQELTEIFDKNRYNGQVGNCNASVGRYKDMISQTGVLTNLTTLTSATASCKLTFSNEISKQTTAWKTICRWSKKGQPPSCCHFYIKY